MLFGARAGPCENSGSEISVMAELGRLKVLDDRQCRGWLGWPDVVAHGSPTLAKFRQNFVTSGSNCENFIRKKV
jgi:hypothetical protein